MGDRSGKESKKENRSTRVHQGRREGTTGPFESEDANNQNHEADQKNGRFVASESAQARHRSRAPPITEQQAHLVINASCGSPPSARLRPRIRSLQPSFPTTIFV